MLALLVPLVLYRIHGLNVLLLYVLADPRLEAEPVQLVYRSGCQQKVRLLPT